jgi:hypothetical protein
MTMILREALKKAGRTIPLTEVIITVKGDLLAECPVTL